MLLLMLFTSARQSLLRVAVGDCELGWAGLGYPLLTARYGRTTVGCLLLQGGAVYGSGSANGWL